MARITIAVTVQPYPMLVVALRRITGRDIGPLAAALSEGQPILELDVDLEAPPGDAVTRMHQLLSLLRVAVLTPAITLDGKPSDESALLELLRNSERVAAQARTA